MAFVTPPTRTKRGISRLTGIGSLSISYPVGAWRKKRMGDSLEEVALCFRFDLKSATSLITPNGNGVGTEGWTVEGFFLVTKQLIACPGNYNCATVDDLSCCPTNSTFFTAVGMMFPTRNIHNVDAPIFNILHSFEEVAWFELPIVNYYTMCVVD